MRHWVKEHYSPIWHYSENGDQHIPMICGINITGSPIVSVDRPDKICSSCLESKIMIKSMSLIIQEELPEYKFVLGNYDTPRYVCKLYKRGWWPFKRPVAIFTKYWVTSDIELAHKLEQLFNCDVVLDTRENIG